MYEPAPIKILLASWLGTNVDQLPWECIGHEDIISLETLRSAPTPLSARLLRLAVFILLRRLDQTAQIGITDFLKCIRSKFSSVPVKPSAHWLPLVQRLAAQLRAAGVLARARKGYVCINHDVDWVECQAAAAQIAETEREYGVYSTFNFLTHWNYPLDRQLVLDLEKSGFEIGLHGAEHDIALAYRSPSAIAASLRKGLDALPVAVKGFRSPALSSSEALFAVLEDLDFVYDSSIATRDLSGGRAGLCFPYRYPGRELWEIPLTLQDSVLFRDLQLGEEEGLEFTVELMHAVVDLGGVFVFNGHPGILCKHMSFYRDLLDRMVEFEVLKMDRIVEIWNDRIVDGAGIFER